MLQIRSRTVQSEVFQLKRPCPFESLRSPQRRCASSFFSPMSSVWAEACLSERNHWEHARERRARGVRDKLTMSSRTASAILNKNGPMHLVDAVTHGAPDDFPGATSAPSFEGTTPSSHEEGLAGA